MTVKGISMKNNSSIKASYQPSYYILVTSDAEHVGGYKVPALKVIKERIEKREWPIYSHTRNRKSFAPGDLCLLYVGGQRNYCQTLFGKFRIEKVVKPSRDYLVDTEDIMTDIPETVLKISDCNIFPVPINIKPILSKLSFFPENEKKWGVVFMGGSRKISEEDYKILIKYE